MPADLELCIILHSDDLTLDFELTGAELGYFHKPVGTVTLRVAPRRHLDALFTDLNQLVRQSDDKNVSIRLYPPGAKPLDRPLPGQLRIINGRKNPSPFTLITPRELCFAHQQHPICLQAKTPDMDPKAKQDLVRQAVDRLSAKNLMSFITYPRPF